MSAGEPRLMADQLLRDTRMNKPPVRLSKLLRAQGVALEKAKLDPHVSSVLLEGPCPEADLSTELHAEGLSIEREDGGRTLRLTVEHPLIGLLADLFWRRA